MNYRKLAEALCRESPGCSLCSLSRVCGEVDRYDPPYEMSDEAIEDMINRLFTPKAEVHMQQEESDG